MSEFPTQPAVGSMWDAPTREVPTTAAKAPPKTKEQQLADDKRRDLRMIILGSSVGGVLLIFMLVFGVRAVLASMRKHAPPVAQGASDSAAASGQRAAAPAESDGSATADDTDKPISGKATVVTIFGFDTKKRELLVDLLVSQGTNSPKAKLQVTLLVNNLKKFAEELDIKDPAEFPEGLEAMREKIVMREIPLELLQGPKMPTVFSKLIADYQANKLGPAEEEVAILVIIGCVGAEIE